MTFRKPKFFIYFILMLIIFVFWKSFQLASDRRDNGAKYDQLNQKEINNRLIDDV